MKQQFSYYDISIISLLNKLLISLFLLFICSTPRAETFEFTPNTEIFQITATQKDQQTILLVWNIKPGFYLYRDHIHFELVNLPHDHLGKIIWPRTNTFKEYPGIGKLPVYKDQLEISIPFIQAIKKTVYLKVNYQGCSEQGFCYRPASKIIRINLSKNSMGSYTLLTTSISSNKEASAPIETLNKNEQYKVIELLEQKNLFVILISFLGIGVLLSFTPCVLPLIPILSSIIIGQKESSPLRNFGLSLSYVLGMSTAYAVAGITFSFVGRTLQATFQQPWLIALSSLIFVAMALSLFGLYNIQLPQRWQTRLTEISSTQNHSTYLSVAIMGSLSSLILSPCVTPALVGVLNYVSQSGNTPLGGLALFIMGIGMGIPLLLIGIFSTKLLPKAGPWMNTVKYILGILMLVLAISVLDRILPNIITMLCWALLIIGLAITVMIFSRRANSFFPLLGKSFAITLFSYGFIVIIGAFLGNTDLLHPLSLASLRNLKSFPHSEKFISVYSLSDIKHQLTLAKKENKPTLIDFYADWCISCRAMEKFIFTNPHIQKALSQFQCLRVDMTRNNLESKQLQNHFGIIAPPTVLFFTPQGKEVPTSRVIGEVSASKFLNHLKRIKIYN